MFRKVVHSQVAVAQRCLFSTSTSSPIGFLGLGAMGKHMANNLVKKGHNLVVFDVVDAPIAEVQKLAESQGRTVVRAASPAAVAEKVDVLITMLPNGKIVSDALAGKDGVFSVLKARKAAGKPSMLIIDSSTIESGTSLELAKQAKELGAHFIDAPVSGGVAGAEKGTLTFMCGAEEKAFEQAKPVLECMGAKVVHCGANSTGLVAKIVNNLILGISMSAVSEGFNLGVALGANPETLAQIVNTSTGRCWSSEVNNPCNEAMLATTRPAINDYNGGFQVDLMLKDLNIALNSAPGVQLPFGKLTAEMYKQISEAGQGKKDFSYMYQYLKSKNQ